MEFKLNQLSFWKVNSAGVKRFIISVLPCIFPILCVALTLVDDPKVITLNRQLLVIVYSFVCSFTFSSLFVVLKLLDERYGKKFFFQLAGLLVFVFVAFEIIWRVRTIEYLSPAPALLVYLFLWVALYWTEKNDLRLSVFFCLFIDEFLKRLIVFLLPFILFLTGIISSNVPLYIGGWILMLLSISFLHISFVCSIPSKEELFDGDVPLKGARFPLSVIFSVVAPIIFLSYFFVCIADVYLDDLCEYSCLFPLMYLLFFFVRTISYFPRLLKGENETWYAIMYGFAWLANVLMSYVIFENMSKYVSDFILFVLLANIVCYLLLILLRTPLKRRWVTIFFSSFILIPIFLFGPWSFPNIEKRITENRVISSIKEFGFEYPLKSENDVKIWKYSMSADDREKMKDILNRYDDKYEMSDLMETRLYLKYINLNNEELDNKKLYYYENLEDELQIPKGFSRFCPDEIEQSVHLNKEDVNGEKTTEIILNIEVLGTYREIYIPIDTALYYGSMNLDEAWEHEFWVKDKIIHEGKEVKFCLQIKEFMFKVYEEQVTDYSVKGILFLE